MPYIQGPYQEHSSLPSPTTTTINSSRNVDFVTQRYTTDSDGNPESMPSTRQRVFMAVSFGAGTPPAFQTEPELERRRLNIIAALGELVSEGAIIIDTVEVGEDRTGTSFEKIDYTDLQTGVDDSVTVWP